MARSIVTVPAGQLSALGRVAAAYSTAPPQPGLLPELSGMLHELVPFDAAAWFATDPLTGLPSAPAFTEGLGGSAWDCVWANEYSEQDVLLFRDLARAELPANSLHRATEAIPERSPRFRNHLKALGVTDELRAVFRVGTICWGQVTLLRCRPAPPFDEHDCSVLNGAGPAVAAALRARVIRVQEAPRTPRPPGAALFTGDGRRLSMDDAAAGWFAEIAGQTWDAPEVPAEMAAVTAVVARANALSSHLEHGPSVARLRADNGRWVVLSASATQSRDGKPGPTVLMVDAARSVHVAQVLLRAFSLTRRERDVTGALLRGLSNAEIAEQLQLSTYTVRDHLTAVFNKLQVANRGELVARLLGEPGVEDR